jgi:hypothetical protein
MFRTVISSIIRNLRLYIQQQAYVLLASSQQYLFDKCLLQYVQSLTPDDERKDRPKHVECYSSKINLRHWCIWLVSLQKHTHNIRNLLLRKSFHLISQNAARQHVKRNCDAAPRLVCHCDMSSKIVFLKKTVIRRTFFWVQCRTLYSTWRHACFIVAGNINLPPKQRATLRTLACSGTTHTECIVVFLRQQWLRDRPTVLRHSTLLILF